MAGTATEAVSRGRYVIARLGQVESRQTPVQTSDLVKPCKSAAETRRRHAAATDLLRRQRPSDRNEPPTDREPALAAAGSAAPPIAARLERDAIVIGIGDRATPELVSARLGCLVEQPEYPGLDLAAACLPGARG